METFKRKRSDVESKGDDKRLKVGGPSDGRVITNFEKKHWNQHDSPSDNNQQHGHDLQKALPESANDALKHVFGVKAGQDVTFTGGDGGQILMKEDGSNGVPVDINQLKPELRKEIEYQVKRYAVAERMEINVEDVNNLKEINGKYYFKDKDGDSFFTNPNDTQRRDIEQDISSLGLDNNKQHIPDSVGREILERATDQETKNETDTGKRQDLEARIKNGTVYSYEYDKGADQYKFYIIQEGKDHVGGTGKTDGNMREVTIDQKSLPSQVKNGLEYHERKVAVMNQLGLEDEIQDLKIVNGELHFKGVDGTPGKIKPTDTQWKNIEAHLDAKGFFNNTQQISESVENAAIQHAIGKETDQAKRDAKEESLENATVYDYTYDKGKKEHVYHIVTKETSPDRDGGTEVRDGKMEKVSFTRDEHKKLLDDATLNAVKKNGELPDGRKITDGMVVAFDPNDKSKFLVTDSSDGGTYTLTGDSGISGGKKLKDAIDSELNVKPRDNTGILTEKSPEVLIGTNGSDSKVEALKEKLAKIESWSPHLLRFMRFMEYANRAGIQAGQSVDQLEAQMLHSQDNPGPQQPMGDVLTEEIYKKTRKEFKKSIRVIKEEIKIAEKASGSGKGTFAGRGIEKMKEFEEMIKNNKDPKGEEFNLSKEQREGFLHDMHDGSDAESDTGSDDGSEPSNSSDPHDRYNGYYAAYYANNGR